MKRRLSAVTTAVLGLVVSLLVAASPAHAETGLRIVDGRLHEAGGNDFVMRGVSHAHTWFPEESSSLHNIKAKGANAVRVVLSSGDQWDRNSPQDVANVVTQCKQNRLICMLEVHDTTGFGEDDAAVSLDRAVDYWTSIKDVLIGQEDYILVNIGNEPYGNEGYQTWAADTSAAINRLRDAGFQHTIVADAPNWGQDHTFTMRDNAAKVLANDPTGNTLFSVHMYGVYEQATVIRDYLRSFVDAGLPIVIGEFGHNHSDGDPDENAIMATAENLGIGYLGWSWSGNGEGVGYLDMVNNFDPNSLTQWGKRIFNGPNGIADTAEEAAIYG